MMISAESIPVIGRAYRFGVNPLTTTLVLLGPVLIALVAVTGRNPLTVGLGIAYVLSLPASVVYFWATESGGDEPEESPDDGG